MATLHSFQLLFTNQVVLFLALVALVASPALIVCVATSCATLSHPQRRDGGGIPDPSVLVLQVVSLGPLVPLTDLPELHRLVYKHKLGRRNM